jgi:hypothetical protein
VTEEELRVFIRRRGKEERLARQQARLEKARARGRTYNATPERRQSNARRHAELRKEVLARYGDKCSCCGEDKREFLAIDHIGGGGNKHRAKMGIESGTSTYLWLRRNNFPSGFRVLCHNCNIALGFYGYCPHQREEK